jgi:hypothetical protein
MRTSSDRSGLSLRSPTVPRAFPGAPKHSASQLPQLSLLVDAASLLNNRLTPPLAGRHVSLRWRGGLTGRSSTRRGLSRRHHGLPQRRFALSGRYKEDPSHLPVIPLRRCCTEYRAAAPPLRPFTPFHRTPCTITSQAIDATQTEDSTVQPFVSARTWPDTRFATESPMAS